MSSQPPSSGTPAPYSSQQPPLPAGQSTNTWQIWVMGFLPLLGIVLTIAEDPGAEFRRITARSIQQIHDAQSGIIATPAPFDSYTLLSWGSSIVIIAIQVALAITDQRTLRRRGILRPMPWGWVFLNPTYIIGRHVVVRRRVHGSLAPLWVYVVTTVIDFAVAGTIIAMAASAAFSSLTSSLQ